MLWGTDPEPLMGNAALGKFALEYLNYSTFPMCTRKISLRHDGFEGLPLSEGDKAPSDRLE